MLTPAQPSFGNSSVRSVGMGIPGRMAMVKNLSWFPLVGEYNYCIPIMPIIMVISQKSTLGGPRKLETTCIQRLLLFFK